MANAVRREMCGRTVAGRDEFCVIRMPFGETNNNRCDTRSIHASCRIIFLGTDICAHRITWPNKTTLPTSSSRWQIKMYSRSTDGFQSVTSCCRFICRSFDVQTTVMSIWVSEFRVTILSRKINVLIRPTSVHLLTLSHLCFESKILC